MGSIETAVIYARLSLDRDGTELGVQRQLEDCRRFATARGWEIIEELVDNDISATTGKRRPAFERLLDGAGRGAWDRVVTWHTDRLVRRTSDLERVIETGVDVHAVMAGHLDLSNPAGRATARTITAWATYEGEQKSERQKLAARQRATMGKPWWPTRPLGFEMDGTLRRDEADALAQVYRDVLDGVPIAECARRLNAQGFTTGRGGRWTQATLRPVLLNPRNHGARTYRGEVVKVDAFEPIVDEGLWRRVHRLMSARERQKGGRAARSLLASVMVCGVCGGRANRYMRGQRGPHPYPVYLDRQGHHATARLGWADDYVRAKTIELAPLYSGKWSEELGVKMATDHQQAALFEERQDLEERARSLGEAFARGTVDLATLEAATASIRERLEAIAGELAGMDSVDALGFVFDAELGPARLGELEVSVQRRLIRSVFESVEMMPRKRGEVHLPGIIRLKPRGFGTLEEAERLAEQAYHAHYAELGL